MLGWRGNERKPKCQSCHCFLRALSEETLAANAIGFPDHFHRIDQPFVNVPIDGAAMNINEPGRMRDAQQAHLFLAERTPDVSGQ
jgi:hypothetical protein